MHFRGSIRREDGSIIVLLLIILAVIGGGYWYMKSERDMREREAWEFADDAARHVVLQQDSRFIDMHLAPQSQVKYPPSFRYRMIEFIKQAGTPNPEFHTQGTMTFTQHFFDPNGNFTVQFDYPNGPAYLELHISHPGSLWVIDDLNWTWTPPAPPPTPAPTMAPVATPSPTPTPSPSPSAARKKKS